MLKEGRNQVMSWKDSGVLQQERIALRDYYFHQTCPVTAEETQRYDASFYTKVVSGSLIQDIRCINPISTCGDPNL